MSFKGLKNQSIIITTTIINSVGVRWGRWLWQWGWWWQEVDGGGVRWQEIDGGGVMWLEMDGGGVVVKEKEKKGYKCNFNSLGRF